MVLRMVTVGSIAMGMIVCVDLVTFLKAIAVLFCFPYLESIHCKKNLENVRSRSQKDCVNFHGSCDIYIRYVKRQSRLLVPYGIICKLPSSDEARARATNKKVGVALPSEWSLYLPSGRSTIDTWEIKHVRITLRNDGELGRAHYTRICTAAQLLD